MNESFNLLVYLLICLVFVLTSVIFYLRFQVSRIGFGCMGLTGIYNSPVPEEDGIAILKEAYYQGVTFWDTSDVYGAEHANEYLVGKVILC